MSAAPISRPQLTRSAAGRVPPHDLEAEAAVLSTLLLDVRRLSQVQLRAADFYSEANGRIYAAIRELAADEKPVDTVTVAGLLKDRQRLASIGGAAYLARIEGETPSVANVGAHAERVARLARRRRVIDRAHLVAAEGYGDVPEGWEQDAARMLAEVAGETAQRARVELVSARDLAQPLPPLVQLVSRFDFVPGAPVLVAGYGFSMKTLSMQAALLAVAYGKPLWGSVGLGRRGPVVHVDYEQGRRLTTERYQRLARGMEIDLAELGDDLAVADMPDLRITDSDARAELTKIAQGRAVMLIDSFRAAAPDVDENSSSARRSLDMLGQVSSRTDCIIIVIHHAKKPQQNDGGGGARMSIRGSGALFDACGSVLVMSGEKGEPARIQHEKARNSGVLADDVYLAPEDLDGPNGEARWGLRLSVTSSPEENATGEARALELRVLEVVRREPGQTTNSLLDAVGCKRQRGLAAVDALLKRGDVEAQQGPRGAKTIYPRGGPR